jgi:hypothetical protein
VTERTRHTLAASAASDGRHHNNRSYRYVCTLPAIIDHLLVDAVVGKQVAYMAV